MNAIKKQYKRERSRIQKAIRRLKKLGFDVKTELPKIPKKITEGSIRRLKKIKTKDIKEQATKVDIETGEIVTAKQAEVRARRARNEAAKRKREMAKWEEEIRPQLERYEYDEPEPEQIPLKAPQREPLDEWQYLVDEIWSEIDDIPNRSIAYKKKPSDKKMASDLRTIHSNVSRAFLNFLNSVSKDAKKKEGAADVLRQILANEWLMVQVYDSGDITKSRYANYQRFADIINSKELSESLRNGMDEDLTDEEEVWTELDENMLNNMNFPEGW